MASLKSLLGRFFLALMLMWAGLMSGAAMAGDDAPTANPPRTNAEIRQWYNDQVATIPVLNEQWLKQGLSAEARARKAQEIRHGARIQARAYMQNPDEVADLQKRDMQVYGNPDGPTFEQLVSKNRNRGLQGDAVYEDIVGSSNRTNADYNKRFNVKPQGAP